MCSFMPSLRAYLSTFIMWKIQIYLDLRKSDKEVSWGKEKAGCVRRQLWPVVGPSGQDAVHENLSSSCQETSQGLSPCSSLIGA